VRKSRLGLIIKVMVLIVMCALSGGWGKRSHLCCSIAEFAVDLLLIEVKNLMWC